MSNATEMNAIARRIDRAEADLVPQYHELGRLFEAGKAAKEWSSLRTAEAVSGVSKSRLALAQRVFGAFPTASAASKAFKQVPYGTTLSMWMDGLGGGQKPPTKAAMTPAQIKASKRLVASADFLALPEGVQRRIKKALGL